MEGNSLFLIMAISLFSVVLYSMFFSRTVKGKEFNMLKCQSPRALLLRKIRNEEEISENDYVKLDKLMEE